MPLGIQQNKPLKERNLSFKNKKESEGKNPVDNSECIIQYVSGMANVTTCEDALYHRL